MLTFILKKEWFEKIERGEKTVEYREVKPYWTRRFKAPWVKEEIFIEWLSDKGETGEDWEKHCLFRLGYTNKCLYAVIKNISIIPGINTDLKIDKPVYAIYFTLAERHKND